MGRVDSLRTFLLPASCLGQLASNTSIKRGVSRFALILEGNGREFQCVKDIAEVELRDSRDSVAIVTHARGPGESA